MTISIDNVGAIQQQSLQDVTRDGSISIGGKSYSVEVLDGQVKVQRQGLGNMSKLERLANGISDFFGRLFNEGALSTRANRLESKLQSMFDAQVREQLETVRGEMEMSRGMLQDHSRAGFITTCVQTMTDDVDLQRFIEQNLDNPLYSKERFTGIEAHPQDPAKFIAKFGEHQLVFSNRASSMNEYRGQELKDQLTGTDYGSLGDLIGQNHLTGKDSMLIYAFTPVMINLSQRLADVPESVKTQVIEAIRDEPIGNSTLGEIFADRLT